MYERARRRDRERERLLWCACRVACVRCACGARAGAERARCGTEERARRSKTLKLKPERNWDREVHWEGICDVGT